MPLILLIDTAVSFSSVCLADEKKIAGLLISPSEKESASWLHTTIRELLHQTNNTLKNIAAVAVSAGPGSYTGLRVGMASAKGLCYALSIPLISISTLQMMAASVAHPSTDLLCPMIDARRMEVFTGLYTASLKEVMAPAPLILSDTSFSEWLETNTISFFGNGSSKAISIIKHPNAAFIDAAPTAADMVFLAAEKFERSQFSDLAYAEPFYSKDFHSSISKINY